MSYNIFHNILFSCVIQTICIPNFDYQFLNPTTQVALFSNCIGNCSTLQNVTWNIYYGAINSSSNITKWTLFNQTDYQDIWFFGKELFSAIITSCSCGQGVLRIHVLSMLSFG
jgi:hypothetical protein